MSAEPFLTPWTHTDPACDRLCGRSHDIPPVISPEYDDEGDDAA